MEKFTVLQGIVAPLDRSNVDTDAIIPKQFLKSIYRTGYGRTDRVGQISCHTYCISGKCPDYLHVSAVYGRLW